MDIPGFSLGGDSDGDFDAHDEFVPEHLPEPGPFLEEGDVLTGMDHVAFHRLTRELFEERGVFDMTFGYNLAKLNLDSRHPDAGYRYAEEPDADGTVLRAEFTPTTQFCPQSDTLAIGSFRAWNGLADRHEYDLVTVRVDWMHHRSDEINEKLRELETEYQEGESVAQADRSHAEKMRERLGSGDDSHEPDVLRK